MAAIGNSPTQQAFTPAIDYFSGNGSTTAFTLSRPVASVAQVQVTIDNVAQNPSSAYTVSANTITFTSAPLSGTNNIYVYYTSPITQVIAPSQGTVQTAQLGNITNIASGNSSLTLQTGSSNTTAVTVDTSQNVGIGITPVSQNGKVLQIDGGATAADIRLTNNATGSAINNGVLLSLVSSDVYLWNLENAFLSLGTNNTERMRIASSGNVGIGTTSPQRKVSIVGTDGASGQTEGNSRTSLFLDNNGANYLTIMTGTSGDGGVFFSDNGQNNGGMVYETSSDALYFRANNAERMRINSSGKILVGTTASFGNGGLLEVDATNQGSNYNGINVKGGTSSYAGVFYSTANNFLYFTISGGGSNGTITWNGSNTVYATTSDQRLKENIVDAPSALNKINSVKIRSFNWIENKKEVDFGVIAQELVEVAPEAVYVPQKEEENWGVDTAVLVPTMIKAIQEQQALITAQAETINALTARIVALENR
jgi:hypothetical protein